jgi:putative ABC transport system permease protein
MKTVWRAMRSQLRRRWTVTVALVLLVGLAGGTVLAALAGASRTNTAMDRFVAYSRPEDVYVVVNGAHGDPSDPAVVAQGLETRRRVLALPQIAAVGRSPYIFMSPDRTGAGLASVNPFAAADAQVFRRFDRPLVLKGRLADPDRADEAVVDDSTAAEQRWHVGSQVTMWSYTTEQNDAVAAAGSGRIPAPAGPSYTFTIVGIVREPTTVSGPPIAVVRDAIYKGEGGLLLTPAFLQRFADDRGTIPEALPGMEGFRVRLRHGLADLGAFERGVSRIVQPGDGQTNVGSDIGNAASASERAPHLEAIALLAFGGLAAASAVLVLGPPLSRHVLTDAGDNPTLAALGMDRRQLGLIPLARASIVAVAGAAVAVAAAIALSPLTPIGLARRAEIHPGVSVNLAVLAFGFLAVALVVLIRTMLPAWRASRVGTQRSLDRQPVRPSPLTGTTPGLGPAAMAGVAMSFERGRGFGFRTALLGIVVAVAGVIASLTFGASLRHLVDTLREQGWNWDVIVGNPNSVALAGDPAADAPSAHGAVADGESIRRSVRRLRSGRRCHCRRPSRAGDG